MTAQIPERRRVARLTVPPHLGGFEVELRLVRLLDLSAEGVRIEHPRHLHEGLVRSVDLPPILGGLRLTGQVVWTRLHKREHTYEGDTRVCYQSGLCFIGLTAQQQAELADALAILKTEAERGQHNP
jgi:hypothetical protein